MVPHRDGVSTHEAWCRMHQTTCDECVSTGNGGIGWRRGGATRKHHGRASDAEKGDFVFLMIDHKRSENVMNGETAMCKPNSLDRCVGSS